MDSAAKSSRGGFTHLYRIMKFVGWLPPKEGIKRYIYFLWSSFVFAYGGFYLSIGLALSLIKDFKRFTPGEFLGVFQIYVNITGAGIKTILALLLINHLPATESILDQLDERLQSKNDYGKIEKAVKRCNYILMLYSKFYFTYTVSDFLAGILTGQPPWLVYNPLFDWRNGLLLLWLQSILEYISMFLMATMILVLDTYPIIFVTMFRAHFEILKDHIRNLRSDPLKTEAENYDELVGCIVDHKLIIQCCNMMRPVMSRTIFVQFLIIGVVLGLTLINVLYFSGLYRGIASLLFLFAVILETFPFCYICDLLAEDSQDLSNLLAQSHWLDAEDKYKSTLRIFLLHLQQPIRFLAGGVFPITINSNFKVAKFAYSVMTIVQQMNLGERLK